MLTNHLIIHFIELPKFIKESKFKNDFERWLGYFKYEGKREDIMQIIVDNSKIFAKAHNRFKNFTKNDELVELYEARQKWQMDKDTAIGYAEMKGIEQGIKDTAVKMLKEDTKISFVSRITGISEKGLIEIKKNMGKEK